MKYGKVQSSNSKVSEDRTDNVDNTANLKNADMLHIDSLTSNINVHFPIDITTSQEISSMNQSNCISAKSLQRFQRWKPGLEPKECWINDEVCFTRGTWIYTVVDLHLSQSSMLWPLGTRACLDLIFTVWQLTIYLHLVVKRAFFFLIFIPNEWVDWVSKYHTIYTSCFNACSFWNGVLLVRFYNPARSYLKMWSEINIFH